jgi:hypothetical protein
VERFSRIFKEHCHFSLSFLPTPTHDNPSQLETEDGEIRSFSILRRQINCECFRTMLEKFQATGVLNNTAVIIMGDHGNRIAGLQYSYTGRIEERMPLFSLYLPPVLRAKYPHFGSNFEHNSNRWFLKNNTLSYQQTKAI